MKLTIEEATLNIHRLITDTLIELAINDDDDLSGDDHTELAESLGYAADLIIQTIGLQVHETDENPDNPDENIVVCTINAAPLPHWADDPTPSTN